MRLLARIFPGLAEMLDGKAAAASINAVAEERRLELLHEQQRGDLDCRESDRELAW